MKWGVKWVVEGKFNEKVKGERRCGEGWGELWLEGWWEEGPRGPAAQPAVGLDSE